MESGKRCMATGALDGEQKKQKVLEIKTGIDEVESLIHKIDIEAQSLQPNVKAVLLAKLRKYKLYLNNLKSEVKRLVSGNLNAATQDELLEGRLKMSTERLNKTSDRIKDGRRTMLENKGTWFFYSSGFALTDSIFFTNLAMRYWLAIGYSGYNVVSLPNFILLDNIILGYALP
ncbi:hypothetical protein UlMin_026337 [Ulmus minor]